MQITVFGASGRVGQQVVRQALERGHHVRAFVHSHNPFQDVNGVTVIQGDISDVKAVRSALQGSEAVISALGSWGTRDKNILTLGMQKIIPKMERLGIERLITLTGSGAFWSQDKPNLLDRIGHASLRLIAPKILADGEKHLALLEASSLRWTCIRSPVMTNRGPVKYRLDLKLLSPLATVSRAAVVQCLLDLAEGRDFERQAPVIHKR
jgi:putative NADH-flavin reductase